MDHRPYALNIWGGNIAQIMGMDPWTPNEG
jgi:hypothetical protein